MHLSPITKVVFDDRVGLPPILVEGGPVDFSTHAIVLRHVRPRFRPDGTGVGLAVQQKLRRTLTIVDGVAAVGSAQLTALEVAQQRTPCPRCGYPETLCATDPSAEIGLQPVLLLVRCVDPGCGWFTTFGARLIREAIPA